MCEGHTYNVGGGVRPHMCIRGSPVSDSTWNMVIEFVGLLVNGVGLGFVAVQVALARRQARETQVARERDLLLRRKESTMTHLIDADDQMRKYQDHLPDDLDAAAVTAY